MGANSTISFWEDKWPAEGPLRKLISGPLNQDDLSVMVGDLNHDGVWNTNSCSFVLLGEIQQKIKVIPIPFSETCTDSMCWAYSPSGLFDGRSAYKLARGEEGISEEFAGNWIWKVDVPPKIQCFIWKCYLYSLPVKDLLATKGIFKDRMCESCGRESETIIHVL